MGQSLRFIWTVVVSLILTLAITVCAFFLMGFVAMRNAQIKLPDDINVVAIGNSHMANAINDSVIPHWRNLSYTGFRYNEMAPPIDLLLANNSQIDTVLLGISVPGFCRFPNESYLSRGADEIRRYILDILSDKELFALNLKNPEFYKVLLLNPPYTLLEANPQYLGTYDRLDTHRLAEHHRLLSEDRHEIPASYMCDYQHHSYHIDGFREIVDICRRHSVELVLFETPQHHSREHFEGAYCWRLLSTLDPGMPVADYYRFQFPDTSYYGDANHLNHAGATYFSGYIRDHGLETVTLGEFVRDGMTECASFQTHKKQH